MGRAAPPVDVSRAGPTGRHAYTFLARRIPLRCSAGMCALMRACPPLPAPSGSARTDGLLQPNLLDRLHERRHLFGVVAARALQRPPDLVHAQPTHLRRRRWRVQAGRMVSRALPAGIQCARTTSSRRTPPCGSSGERDGTAGSQLPCSSTRLPVAAPVVVLLRDVPAMLGGNRSDVHVLWQPRRAVYRHRRLAARGGGAAGLLLRRCYCCQARLLGLRCERCERAAGQGPLQHARGGRRQGPRACEGPLHRAAASKVAGELPRCEEVSASGPLGGGPGIPARCAALWCRARGLSPAQACHVLSIARILSHETQEPRSPTAWGFPRHWRAQRSLGPRLITSFREAEPV